MIGAVVGVQPFGGFGLSGTGPKAGGPHYLARFATEQTVTVNTAAAGGNAAFAGGRGVILNPSSLWGRDERSSLWGGAKRRVGVAHGSAPNKHLTRGGSPPPVMLFRCAHNMPPSPRGGGMKRRALHRLPKMGQMARKAVEQDREARRERRQHGRKRHF